MLAWSSWIDKNGAFPADAVISSQVQEATRPPTYFSGPVLVVVVLLSTQHDYRRYYANREAPRCLRIGIGPRLRVRMAASLPSSGDLKGL